MKSKLWKAASISFSVSLIGLMAMDYGWWAAALGFGCWAWGFNFRDAFTTPLEREIRDAISEILERADP